MARTYKRDASGRFASGGGSSGGGRSGGKAAAKSKPAKRSAPKTTSARGRALQNQRRAAALVSASRGGTGPSAKAVRSVLTAQRARAFYAATGGGKKRSAVKPATKKTAKATAAAVRARTKGGSGAKPKGNAKVAGGVAKPARPIRPTKTAAQIKAQADRLLDRLKGQRLGDFGSRRYTLDDRISRVNAAAKRSIPTYRHNPLRKGGSAREALREANRQYGPRARAAINIGRGQRDIRGY